MKGAHCFAPVFSKLFCCGKIPRVSVVPQSVQKSPKCPRQYFLKMQLFNCSQTDWKDHRVSQELNMMTGGSRFLNKEDILGFGHFGG